ncbi:MAG: hypothetical protein ACHQ7M_23190 [Chloroflexota bacterium]|jgi:hypothetical protein
MIKPGALAAAAGVGLAAGLAGTAAMSLSSTIEARIRHREPSTAPADAAAKLLGVKPEGEQQAKRFNTISTGPPLTKQDATEIAIDIWHSVVYAAAAGAAYEALNSTR